MQSNPWCHRGLSSSSIWLQITVIILALTLGALSLSLTCCVTLGKSLNLSEPHLGREANNPFPMGCLKTEWANEFSIVPMAGKRKIWESVCYSDLSHSAAIRARTSLMIGQQEWIVRPQRGGNELSALSYTIAGTKEQSSEDCVKSASCQDQLGWYNRSGSGTFGVS